MQYEPEIDNGTDAAVEIAGIIERLKMAAYHLEGLELDLDTLYKVDHAIFTMDDVTDSLEQIAEDCFDAANSCNDDSTE